MFINLRRLLVEQSERPPGGRSRSAAATGDP